MGGGRGGDTNGGPPVHGKRDATVGGYKGQLGCSVGVNIGGGKELVKREGKRRWHGRSTGGNRGTTKLNTKKGVPISNLNRAGVGENPQKQKQTKLGENLEDGSGKKVINSKSVPRAKKKRGKKKTIVHCRNTGRG